MSYLRELPDFPELILFISLPLVPDSLVYATTSSSPVFNLMPPPAPREKLVTEAERIESVKVLAAANTLVGLVSPSSACRRACGAC